MVLVYIILMLSAVVTDILVTFSFRDGRKVKALAKTSKGLRDMLE